ncbi:MAG: deoxynucleoside kinase [Sedimentisphaerales bacterium]|nr:deoxynucleoside kinase [Sedimentisphaerales bacterium]
MTAPTLICIAGCIGIGKTSLARALSRSLSAELILEEYDRNPFLADQIARIRSAALPSEVFFLLSRFRQLGHTACRDRSLMISDYVFAKNRLFARLNLAPAEYDLYCQLEDRLLPDLLAPGLVIYLQGSIGTCLERIRRRGRPFESQISESYLARLSAAYEDLFGGWDACPLVRWDAECHDFRDARQAEPVAAEVRRMIGCGWPLPARKP